MPALHVTCPHCQRVTTIDSEKVPDQPVSYRCPSCQGKVVIDKRKLLSGGVPDAPSAPVESASAAPPAAAASRPAAKPAPAAPPPAAAQVPTVISEAAILELTLPPGETIPPGYLVAENREVGAQLQRILEPFDCILEPLDAATARDRSLQEPPPLLFYVADSVGKPPYPGLEPLVGLPPRERRQTFIVLVADNVKTLDGNLAFLYGCNLVLNKQHLPQVAGILYSALRYHQRLYRAFVAALNE